MVPLYNMSNDKSMALLFVPVDIEHKRMDIITDYLYASEPLIFLSGFLLASSTTCFFLLFLFPSPFPAKTVPRLLWILLAGSVDGSRWRGLLNVAQHLIPPQCHINV